MSTVEVIVTILIVLAAIAVSSWVIYRLTGPWFGGRVVVFESATSRSSWAQLSGRSRPRALSPSRRRDRDASPAVDAAPLVIAQAVSYDPGSAYDGGSSSSYAESPCVDSGGGGFDGGSSSLYAESPCVDSGGGGFDGGSCGGFD